jgi:hypothetical protein
VRKVKENNFCYTLDYTANIDRKKEKIDLTKNHQRAINTKPSSEPTTLFGSFTMGHKKTTFF